MSHYKPYPAYRDSGVEWIGEVPEGWTVQPVKHLYSARLGKMVQPQSKSDDDVLVPYHRAQTVQWERIEHEQVEPMWASPAEIETYSLEEGDLLICEGGDVCRAAIFSKADNKSIIFQNSIHRVRPLNGNQTEWLLRLMQIVRSTGWIDVLCSKNTIVHFTSDKLASLDCPRPPLDEQKRIVTVLRDETTRIDALIAKKTRFIELLDEKILAMVDHSFEQQDTTWIRLKHICEIINRPVSQKNSESYTRLGLYNRGRGIFKKEETDNEDMGDSDFFWVEDGDLILSGQFAWEGAVAMATKEHSGCVVSHRFPVIRGIKDVSETEYLLALLMTRFGDFILNDCSRGSAGRNRPLNINTLLMWKIPLPPIEYQRKIMLLVSLRERLRIKTQHSIDLLKERRSALITAAITGQIDLRN